jgi:glutamate synthase (NADPH/NADH) large chain
MKKTDLNKGEREIAKWRETAERLNREGLYDPADEHDSCGVGMVVSIDGTRRREVVEAGIAALKALWHRGAVDADGKTGDGAGIHVEIPQDFFHEHTIRTGQRPAQARLRLV